MSGMTPGIEHKDAACTQSQERELLAVPDYSGVGVPRLWGTASTARPFAHGAHGGVQERQAGSA